LYRIEIGRDKKLVGEVSTQLSSSEGRYL